MNPSSDSEDNVAKWNEVAKGTPFEGMGDVLDNAVKSSMQKRQDLLDRVDTQQELTDDILETLVWGEGQVAKSNVKILRQLITAREQRIEAEARKEGRQQVGEKIEQYSERADFFKPDAQVVLAHTMIWLSGLDEANPTPERKSDEPNM